jgi:nitric oxide reductase large subunit
MIEVMTSFLSNIIAFLSSDIGFWFVGAVIFGFLLRLLIQCFSALLR